MPYIPLSLPDHVHEPLLSVCRVVEGALREIRFIMSDERLYAGPTDRLQKSIATLLLSATDGAAQIFVPVSETDNGKRFKRFLRENFPWDEVEMEQEAAREYMWKSARCSLIHRFGFYSGGDQRKVARSIPRIGDRPLMALEQGEKPPRPFIVQESGKTVIWIEGLYWALRHSIVNALITPEKARNVTDYLASRDWG